MITIERLKQIRDQHKPTVEFRQENSPDAAKIIVAMGTCGIAAGARDVLLALAAEVAKQKIHHVIVTQSGCLGQCAYEPVLQVVKDGQTVVYGNVTAEKALEILRGHVQGGQIVEAYTLHAANGK